jgi:uncharacterized protein (DUF433 family)
MTGHEYTLIGSGIYTVSEASRLTQVSTWRIRRWIRGYSFRTRREIHTSHPVVQSRLASINDSLALSFVDLVEVKLVDRLLERGVTWKTLREASRRGAELLGQSHPFSTGRFWTDGKTVLLELAAEEQDAALLDVIRDQYIFKKVLAPFLAQLDFEQDSAIRWWPLGKQRRIVIDPARSFGQPIVSREGVPTLVLAKAVKVERSLESVAKWFKVSRSSLRDAVDFENRLAA